MQKLNEQQFTQWRTRLKKRRGKAFKPVAIRELNLVAMMDMLTLILVFLLKSYSVSAMSIPVGEEMDVPKSSNMVRPPEAVKLSVTKMGGKDIGVIAVDEVRVMDLSPENIAKLEGNALKRNFLIPDLHKALVTKADGIRAIAARNPSIQFDGKILVIADKNTPYWLITGVLFTAAEAQFEQYKLVALKQKEE